MADNNHGESRRLLTPRGSNVHTKQRPFLYCPLKICMSSKPVFMILLWTAIVGAIYAFAVNGCLQLFLKVQSTHPQLLVAIIPPYVIVTFMMLCFPLNGLLADVCCGRYRVVMISLCLMCCSLLFGSVFFAELKDSMSHYFYIFGAIGALLAIAGISGYQANIIQFGLDQLMDAPSRYSGLFIHWVMWCSVVGTGIVNILYVAWHAGCNITGGHALRYLAVVCFLILLVVFIFSYYKRRWFHSEPGYQNPYKMVCKVLNFARKHKSPIYRSALTYYDDRKPSRIDFAKEQYGGPFTSEQVEDVKTFLRILTVLISISPVYVLEVPTSYYVFPLFSLHTTSTSGSPSCSVEWIFLQSGSMNHFITVVFFPTYIWLVYTVLPELIPSLKIVHRISFGITMLLLGAISMLLIDVTGHALLEENYSNSSLCMFAVNTKGSGVIYHETLNIPSSVLIVPNMLVGIGHPVLIVTVLEFISAQSPHSMKGLMVGVFFATRGCVQLLSSFAVLPFSLNEIWEPSHFISHHPPLTNCGFGYFLFTIAVALIGLIVFSVVAKRYKYRQRGEDPYGPHIVEQVVSNNLRVATPHLKCANHDVVSESESDECLS